jgi:phosphatidylinositol kinase/protein kinase (PI-3  family)
MLNDAELNLAGYASREFNSDLKTEESKVSQSQSSSSAKKTKAKIIKKDSFDNETSKVQKIRIRDNSPFGKLRSWNLVRVIVKSMDDVRQEQFAMQLIS